MQIQCIAMQHDLQRGPICMRCEYTVLSSNETTSKMRDSFQMKQFSWSAPITTLFITYPRRERDRNYTHEMLVFQCDCSAYDHAFFSRFHCCSCCSYSFCFCCVTSIMHKPLSDRITTQPWTGI